MGRNKYTWYFNGIKVTRRWLEFNYGRRLVNEFIMQVNVLSVSVPHGSYAFNNGISVTW